MIDDDLVEALGFEPVTDLVAETAGAKDNRQASNGNGSSPDVAAEEVDTSDSEGPDASLAAGAEVNGDAMNGDGSGGAAALVADALDAPPLDSEAEFDSQPTSAAEIVSEDLTGDLLLDDLFGTDDAAERLAVEDHEKDRDDAADHGAMSLVTDDVGFFDDDSEDPALDSTISADSGSDAAALVGDAEDVPAKLDEAEVDVVDLLAVDYGPEAEPTESDAPDKPESIEGNLVVGNYEAAEADRGGGVWADDEDLFGLVGTAEASELTAPVEPVAGVAPPQDLAEDPIPFQDYEVADPATPESVFAEVPTAPPIVVEPAVVPPVAPARPGTKPRIGRRKKLRARKSRRVIRHIDPWSVLAFSVFFHIFVFSVLLLASVLVWGFAIEQGMVENVENFIQELGDYETFKINADVMFRAAIVIAGLLTLASSIMVVLLTIVFNIISDLIGGIRVTVIEEETVRVPVQKRTMKPSPPKSE